MKVLVVTPTFFPKITGNAVCTKRIVDGLRKLGHKVLVKTPEEIVFDEIVEFKPDIIHGLHAYRTKIVLEISKKLETPYIITLTGSDYEECIDTDVKLDNTLCDPGKREKTLEVMKNAYALVVYNEETLQNVKSKIGLSEKLHVIQKGKPIVFGDKIDIYKEYNIDKDSFVFTLVSGVRKRKNNIFSISPLTKLHEIHKNIVLLLVGPVSDEEYNKELLEVIKNKDWVKYVGPLDIKKMESVYLISHVVLNTSQYEGESNAIVEALCYGKPVIASAVPGNTPLFRNGINGLLYKNEDENDFFKKAEMLYSDCELYKKISYNAKLCCNKITNSDEPKLYAKLYENAIKS